MKEQRKAPPLSARMDARRRAGVWTTVGAVLVLAGGMLLLLSPRVDAEQQFLSRFAAAYPAAAGTALDSCLLCHRDPAHPDEDNLNRYGRDWEEIGDGDFLSPALARRDSDGDGVPNGAEIDQLSFPGDPSSAVPPTTTTTVPGTPPDGSALFAARCASCHGTGGGNLAGTRLGRSSFVSITLDGRGSMPAQTGLTGGEAGAIWDYLTGSGPGTTTTTTTAPAAGAAVWARHCAACHGPDGGNLVPTARTRAQLVSIISNGTGSMPGFPGLGSAQIGRVADYLLSRGTAVTTTTTTPPGVTTTTTTPLTGATVWARHCAACHGADGGNLAGRDLSPSRIASVTTGGVPGMPGFGTRLSRAEIDGVARFVTAQGPGPTTTTVPAAAVPPVGTAAGSTAFMQNCSACHGLHGEGGAAGPIAGSALSLPEIITVIETGTEGMPGYGALLTPAEITAVADHVRSLGPGAGQDAAAPGPGPGAAGPATTAPAPAGLPADQSDRPQALVAPPGGGEAPSVIGPVLIGLLGLAAGVVVTLWGRSLRTLLRWRGDD